MRYNIADTKKTHVAGGDLEMLGVNYKDLEKLRTLGYHFIEKEENGFVTETKVIYDKDSNGKIDEDEVVAVISFQEKTSCKLVMTVTDKKIKNLSYVEISCQNDTIVFEGKESKTVSADPKKFVERLENKEGKIRIIS